MFLFYCIGAPASAGYSASKHALQVVVFFVAWYKFVFTQGYFDSLRMEVKCDNIDVQLVCPGPVVSSVSLNAFSSQLDKVCAFLFYTRLMLFCISLFQIWKKTKRVE